MCNRDSLASFPFLLCKEKNENVLRPCPIHKRFLLAKLLLVLDLGQAHQAHFAFASEDRESSYYTYLSIWLQECNQ